MTEVWHFIVDPFEFNFMIRALGVAILVGIVCAVLSCFITLKGWSLMGDAVSHAVLPGVVLAYVVGLPFGIGAFIFGLLSVVVIGWISDRTRLRNDAVIGIVFTAFFGLGLVLMSKLPSLGDWVYDTFGYRAPLLSINSVMFGNVLGIRTADIVQIVVTGAITLGLILVYRRDLVLFCFDPNHARAIGLNTGRLNLMLLSLLALTIVTALQTIGIVLVVAMLVTPGAIAFLLTNRFDRMLLLAASTSVISSVVGVYASYYLNISTGGAIVFTQSIVFGLVLLFAPRRGFIARRMRRTTTDERPPTTDTKQVEGAGA